MVRTKLNNSTCTTPDELKEVLNDVKGVDTTVFDPNSTRYWHGAMKSFGKLPKIKKRLYCQILISKNEDEVVIVKTRDSIVGERNEHLLCKKKSYIPAMNGLEAMKPINSTPLSLALQSDLYKSVYLYLLKTNRLNSDSNLFWTNLPGQDVIYSHILPASSSTLEPTNTSHSIRRVHSVGSVQNE